MIPRQVAALDFVIPGRIQFKQGLLQWLGKSQKRTRLHLAAMSRRKIDQRSIHTIKAGA